MPAITGKFKEIRNLKESNEFLNVLFDNITSAIFLIDKDIRVNDFNDSFRTLFHGSEDRILGQLCGNALGCSFAVESGKDCGQTINCQKCQLRENLLVAFLHKVPVTRQSLVRDFYIGNQKIRKHFLYSTRLLQFNDEEVVMVIVDDVTELESKRIEMVEKNKELESLNKQKNELLGIAAHDLRNPIGIIKSFADLLKQSNKNAFTPDQLHFLDIINSTSLFCLDLLSNLLDISKIEAGKLDLHKREQDYHLFIRNNLERNRIIAQQKNIQVVFEPSNPELFFFFDDKKMDQVMNNLIDNAIKFSFPEKKITITTKKEDDQVYTCISDQGQGIPEEELPLLFKAFKRTSVQSTANEKSTGLGLAIVKKIIEVHGGRIEVRSTLGEGTSFCFYLPCK